MEIEQIKKKTIDDLASLIEDLRNIRFENHIPYNLNTKDIQDVKYVDRFLKRIKREIDHKKFKYIYTFYLLDNFPIDDIYNRYANVKESKKSGRAYARLNRKSRCLYVGSSNGLISRIRQHLGFGPAGTYTIQLRHWCENLDFEFSINIYAFGNDISIEAFQAFEDGAWESLMPMFGRQGKK